MFHLSRFQILITLCLVEINIWCLVGLPFDDFFSCCIFVWCEGNTKCEENVFFLSKSCLCLEANCDNWVYTSFSDFVNLMRLKLTILREGLCRCLGYRLHYIFLSNKGKVLRVLLILASLSLKTTLSFQDNSLAVVLSILLVWYYMFFCCHINLSTTVSKTI